MAISETTKQIIRRKRDELMAERDAIETELAHLQAQIQPLRDREAALKVEWDALKKDIPEPTPPPEL